MDSALFKALLINGARSVNSIYDFRVNSSSIPGVGIDQHHQQFPGIAPERRHAHLRGLLYYDQRNASPVKLLATGQSHTRIVSVYRPPGPFHCTLPLSGRSTRQSRRRYQLVMTSTGGHESGYPARLMFISATTSGNGSVFHLAQLAARERTAMTFSSWPTESKRSRMFTFKAPRQAPRGSYSVTGVRIAST